MDHSDGEFSIHTLHRVLLDAMNQSRALFGKLEHQNKAIDTLRNENESFRKEIEILKDAAPRNVESIAAKILPPHAELTEQLDQLFQQNASKEAEIEQLKAELRAARKERSKQRMKASHLVSPDKSSDVIEYVPSSHPRRVLSPAATMHPASTSKRLLNVERVSSTSPVQKRAKLGSDEALQHLPASSLNARISAQHRKSQDRAAKAAEAIPTLTEDGEDHNWKVLEVPVTKAATEKRHPGAHSRLRALLSTASPSTATLDGPNLRAAESISPRTPVQRVPSFTKSTSDVGGAAKAEKQSGLRFLKPVRQRAQGHEDEEPFRSRPLQRLNLSHFRLNPEYTGLTETTGPAWTKEQKKCLPGCIRPECCGNEIRAIALTLGPNMKLSDDDLLLDFLGPGSEKKITTLTSIARDNLVHEARVKRAADTYGKKHRGGNDRAVTPAGFWDTELPGSQEMRKEREEARLWERAEVGRRYAEACQSEGRWTFADEL